MASFTPTSRRAWPCWAETALGTRSEVSAGGGAVVAGAVPGGAVVAGAATAGPATPRATATATAGVTVRNTRATLAAVCRGSSRRGYLVGARPGRRVPGIMAAPLAPVELIERSRRAEHVDAESVESFVRAWLDGTASDALMAAWLMVACLRGLGAEQAGALARALVASGDRLELASLGPTGDLQTTGGVGDATPLVAAPLAASLGVRIASLGGRSMGHTGGAIDKLEAIPGFLPDLGLAGFVRQVRDVGIAVVASDPRLVPGDRRLRALRDATGTAVSGGLVAASVVSTAVAGGAGAVHVDVKAGSGGLVGEESEARAAAALMAEIAGEWGRTLRWTVSDGERPPGRCVGNALEVGEAGAVLRGEGSEDLRELAEEAAGALAEAAGVVPAGEGRERAAAALRQGDALAMAQRWIEAQEGDPAVWTDPQALPSAPVRIDVPAPAEGRVEAIAGRGIGEVARWLGVGRLHADQSIDPVVGIELLARPGDRVGLGDPLAVIHARDEWAGERAAEMLAPSFRIGSGEGRAGPAIIARGPARCLSSPRSRRSGRSWPTASPAARSPASRSTTPSS